MKRNDNIKEKFAKVLIYIFRKNYVLISKKL